MIDLKKVRSILNFNQKEFAALLEVSQPYLSDIENGKEDISKPLLFKVKQLIKSKKIDYDSVVNEPQEKYLTKFSEEYDSSFEDVYTYQVSETNQISYYDRGDLLKCKRVHFNEYIPTGVPYLFVTKLNQLHVVRYLIEKHAEYMKISDTRESTTPESLPISDLDKLYIIKEVVKKVND